MEEVFEYWENNKYRYNANIKMAKSMNREHCIIIGEFPLDEKHEKELVFQGYKIYTQSALVIIMII